jgi:hypothetical protein
MGEEMTEAQPKPPPLAAFGPLPSGPSPQNLMQLALNGPVPRFYANHLGIAQTATDVSVVFVSNNSPVATVSLSYETITLVIDEMQRALTRF